MCVPHGPRVLGAGLGPQLGPDGPHLSPVEPLGQGAARGHDDDAWKADDAHELNEGEMFEDHDGSGFECLNAMLMGRE